MSSSCFGFKSRTNSLIFPAGSHLKTKASFCERLSMRPVGMKRSARTAGTMAHNPPISEATCPEAEVTHVLDQRLWRGDISLDSRAKQTLLRKRSWLSARHASAGGEEKGHL
eukprot:1808680-Rhodomonas_salina.1